jgi:hypothetical protein
MTSGVFISIDQDGWTKGIQLSIGTEDHGYRIAGPKFNGSSKTLKKHALDARDIAEIESYIKVAKKNLARAASQSAEGSET